MDTPAIERNGRRPRIGVVDDDAGVTELLAGVLEARGWAVRVGASIAAARALVDEGLDVLLIDLWLPDGTGVDVARETAGHRDPPEVVIMTAEATLESAVQTVSTGASEYLLKPLDLARLRELLEALLERRRRRELRERATVALRGQRREARRREAAQYGVARILAEAI
ncbi:MAG TPA: response regulator, partial [Terriglobales bacterium]|nr:response regulator [Terriglobales bacterium]